MVQLVEKTYEKLKSLGGGAFGSVYKAVEKTTGNIVAIKETHYEQLNDGTGASFMTLREVAILKKLSGDPNIVSIFDVKIRKVTINKEEKTVFCLVFEFMDGDLKTFIRKYPGDIPPQTIKSLMYQLCKGIAFCHSHGILHRDLKPQNLLICPESMRLKIADFGLSREMAADVPFEKHGYTKEIQSLNYKAPEIIAKAVVYSTTVDIWSIGCIFAELVTKEILFRGKRDISQLHCIFMVLGTATENTLPGVDKLHSKLKMEKPEYKAQCLSEKFPNLEASGIDLLSQMLQIAPEKRISAKKALQHHYFDDLDKTCGSNTITGPSGPEAA